MKRCEGNYLYLDPVVVGVGDDNVILELLNFVFLRRRQSGKRAAVLAPLVKLIRTRDTLYC
jgi:hypothetical protein